MSWVERINSAVSYIESHLDREIDIAELARIAHCSAYNFQRMFSYLADKTLAEYVRCRRLTVAAFDIIHTDERIIDIAARYGYESHDAFTRAFQRFHGVLPSQARSAAARLRSCPKISFQITVKGEREMEYQIVKWPAFSVAGIRHRMKNSEAFARIPGIWDRAFRDGTGQRFLELWRKADSRPSGLLGICAGGDWGNAEEMDYYLAVTTYVDAPECERVDLPADMGTLDFPAATWAVFDASGKLPEAVQRIWKTFYSEWLPNSGFELADLPAIETYMQNDVQEVWIPVVKK